MAAIPALKSPTERDTPNTRASIAKAGIDPTDDNATGQLNSPELNEEGKPTQRAITTAKQAWTIAKALRDRAKSGRIERAAQIASKYNGDPPFTKGELDATGQNWRANFSTNFLASIVDRVTPQLTDPVSKADLLTHSTLPNGFTDGSAKSRKFCEVTTKLIRAWEKWKDLLSGMSKEIVLYGNAVPARIDRNWRPRLWSFGDAFLPEGTGQHAKDVQVFVCFQPILLHEFIKLFEDKAAAKKANYNLQGCIEIANRTTGSQNDAVGNDPTAMDKMDMVREGGGPMAWSYANQSKNVGLFHILVRDYTGEVDLWTVEAEKGTEVRHELGLHGGIEEALALFTFQSGNRKFYGSKGLGRLEANLHTAIERGRNLGMDQMYLSGLLIFQGDPKDSAKLQFRVRHPFVIVDADAKIVTETIQFNAEAWGAMDQKLVTIAESIAGAFIPPNLEGEGSSNTKIEAAQKAERELAVKEGVLGRFFDHLSDLVSMMQKGIYSVDNIREALRIYKLKKDKMEKSGIRLIIRKVWNIMKKAGAPLDLMESVPEINTADEEAVNAIVELLEGGLTVEEIITLSLQPAGSNSNDEGVDKDNRTLAWIANNRQNPALNQQAATEMDAKITIGEDRAKALVIPQDDSTIADREMRQQIIEISEMVDGNAMAVVATDNHIAHRQALGPRLGDIIHAMEQAPTTAMLKAADLMVTHYEGHLGMDTISPKPQVQQELGVMKTWRGVLDKAAAALQKRAQEIQAAGGTMGPDGNPVPVAGKPLAAAAPDGTNPMQVTPDHQIAAGAAYAEIEARARDQDLEQQRIDLDRQEQQLATEKHDHAVTKDAIQLQQSNVGILQKTAEDVAKHGQSEADRELAQATAQNQAQGKE